MCSNQNVEDQRVALKHIRAKSRSRQRGNPQRSLKHLQLKLAVIEAAKDVWEDGGMLALAKLDAIVEDLLEFEEKNNLQ